MDFPDKPTILKDILKLLHEQYQNNGYLESFPLDRDTTRRPALRSSRSQPINIFQEFGPHFHQDNLFLQYLLLQYFIGISPSPSLTTRYQMYSNLNIAYGRKRLFSDEEMKALMTTFYANPLRNFLSNPIICEGVILYDIMQSIKIYELFNLFDRIQYVAMKVAEENAKGADGMTHSRLSKLLELDRRREELSMEEVIQSFLPIKDDYEKDLELIHQIIEGAEEYLEEFPLLAATVAKDFEFASLLSVPPFSEELKAIIGVARRQGQKRRYKTTMKNKGSSK